MKYAEMLAELKDSYEKQYPTIATGINEVKVADWKAKGFIDAGQVISLLMCDRKLHTKYMAQY